MGPFYSLEMVIGGPPLERGEQFARESGGGPGATGEGCPGVSQGEIDSLDNSGIEGAREAEGLGDVARSGNGSCCIKRPSCGRMYLARG
jgi:hypothetical protein